MDAAGDPTLIRDLATPQGEATDWLINQDARVLCPDDEKLVQRWVITVMYFSSGGDNWFQCSAAGSDSCGTEDPFEFKRRFLSEFSECDWAGISCNSEGSVIEVEFEQNNLVGTIPTEMGVLTDLRIWGMERGDLSGRIPSEIGNLSNLIFLDLDFNDLTGSIPTELFTLTTLTQLDLNNNHLTGDVAQIGVFEDLQFLQLHNNDFTGEIPPSTGALTGLGTFTLHNTFFSGTMPTTVCDLLATNGGQLTSLIADCAAPAPGVDPEIFCDCCTDCRGA